MKRDARIGLAVVLVLGLAVTLLIGRAIFKRDAELAADKPDTSAPYSHESSDPAAAAAHVAPDLPRVQPNDGALNSFREDQTRALQPAFPARLPDPIPAPRETAGTPGRPAPAPNPIPHPMPEDLLDHEHIPAPSSSTMAPPANTESYGYTITAGDNIWKISSKVYGDGKYTQKIVDANKGLNVQKMKPGMVLRIPQITNKTILTKLPSYDEAVKIAAAPKSAKPAEPVPAVASSNVTAEKKSVSVEATTHKVAAGETLSSIAKKHYGTSGPKTLAHILSANQGLNPAKLKVGQEVAIPAMKN